MRTDPSCLPHAEEGPQHVMATTRPGGVCVVSNQHGNPFLRSSARGKACCKQPASQLRMQGSAWLCRGSSTARPRALLRTTSSLCSGVNQKDFPGISEACKLRQLYFVCYSLAFFSVLSFFSSAGTNPLPDRGKSRCSELHKHQGVSESHIPVQGWREPSPA